jgi:uncharacterized protein involved in cysteine biosynthesis
MGIVLIAGLATACILTAVESLLIQLGKWRGLLALVFSLLFCLNLGTRLLYLFVYSLAATFLSLTVSIAVEQIFTGTNARQARGLPNRVDRL